MSIHFLSLLIILLSITNFAVAATESSIKLHSAVKGRDLDECKKKLKPLRGGWCEVRYSEQHPSITRGFYESNLDLSKERIGRAPVSVFDSDGGRIWKTLPWGGMGASERDQHAYDKRVYLEKEVRIAELSTHEAGVRVYKYPKNGQYIEPKYNVQKLVDSAKPGSTLIIPPGVYPRGLFINKSLTLGLKDVSLRGVAKRKGIINVSCDGCRVFIEDFNGDGVKANCQWGNCAGVKAEGRNFSLTLRRAHIDRTVMGVLTDNRGGSLVLEDSLIENTGWEDRSTTLGHGVYAGLIDRVVVKNSIIRRSFGAGHLFKSRAKNTLVERSVIAGLDGHHSRTIDFPCGGQLVVKNSVLQHGVNSDNLDLISIGTEYKSCGGSVLASKVILTENWIIIDRSRLLDEHAGREGANQLFTWRAPIDSVKAIGNIFVGTTQDFIFDGEGNIPDMFEQNSFYSSRAEAGLDRATIPMPDRSKPN